MNTPAGWWAIGCIAALLAFEGAQAAEAGELWETRLQLEQAGQAFGPETAHRSCRAAGAPAIPTVPMLSADQGCPDPTLHRSADGFRLSGQCHGKRYAAVSRRVAEGHIEGRIEAEMGEGAFTARFVERRMGRCDPATFRPAAAVQGPGLGKGGAAPAWTLGGRP